MRMLFAGTDPDIFNLFKVITSSFFKSEIIHVTSSKETVKNLENADFELIICLLPLDEPELIFNYLRDKKKKVPILFTTDIASLSECHKLIGHHPLTGKVSYEADTRILKRSIERLLSVYAKYKRESEEFYALPIKYFLELKEYQSDVFIKLKNDKFVRVNRGGDQVLIDDISKYKGRGCTQFFLKKSDFMKTTNLIVKTIRHKIKSSNINQKQLNMISNLAHDSMCKLIPELGLKTEVLEMASIALNNLNMVMEQNINISKMMRESLNQSGYKSEHSLFLCYLCAAIAKETPWNTQEDINNLTLAAFFHDSFMDESFSEMALGDETKEGILSEEALKKYLYHPTEAVEFVSKLDGISPEVNKIIMSHHEKLDGSGFPYGRDWTKIVPLAAIFIVAEDFANCIYSGGKSIDFIDEILIELDIKYSKGNFKKITHGLRICLASPNLPTIKSA